MPIKAKYNGSYKDITDLMNVDESIDYVLAKTSSSYKRVYTATRSIEDAPPTTFKSIKPGANLTDYRIYGQTSRNLCEKTIIGVNISSNGYISDDVQYDVGYAKVVAGETYTINSYVYAFFEEEPKKYDRSYNNSRVVGTYPSTFEATINGYVAFRTDSSSKLQCNEGNNLLPYEPYGESVGDRTGNLFDKSQFIQSNLVLSANSTYIVEDPYTISTILPCKPNTKYTITKIITNRFSIWGCENYPVADGNGNGDIVRDYNATSLTFTTGSNDNFLLVMLFYQRQPNDPTVEDVKNNLMYNYGEMCPYEPYGYKVPMTVEGKNLYKISTFRDGSTSVVVSAVTFTINNNAVSISGISSAQHPSVTSQRFELISGETYSAKIFVDGSYDGKMYIIMRGGERQDGSDEVKYKRIDVGSGDTFVAKTYNSIIYVAEGTNKEFNAIVRVILIKGSMLPDTYEPYHAPVTTPIYLPEQIRKVGDEAEYIDFGEQKFVKKFYKITLNFDDMNNDETFPGWSNVTAVVEYCNKIRSLAIDSPDSYTPLQYSSINEFRANFNVRGNRSILYLGASFIIGHTQSELKEIYAGQSITFILKIPDTDLNVTLPALPTLPGTNVLSVGTEVQPSKIDITGHIKTISGGS